MATVEHRLTSVKLLIKKDVDHRTNLFDSRATNFLPRMGSPAVLEVRHVIGSADNQRVALVGVEYLSKGAFLRKSEWLLLIRAYKMKLMFEMAAAATSQEVEHRFTSVKLLTKEDVDHGTLLFAAEPLIIC
ncbi:hypothetical protein TorRG33x02_104660 [Trema orientale]|uniref:Uncharacterized protein n=1 Tax=Trema orientale TaxID=63057 RepID=A0A2P5F7J1_TREOI|nr:hypothetical protein TorRG33x02_104660 [Trema orientale]